MDSKNQTIHNSAQNGIPNQPPKQFSVLLILLPLLIFLLLVSTSLLAYQNWQLRQQLNAPVTYAECIKAPGSVLQESYPATCVTKDGKKSFKQILTDDEKKKLDPPDLTADWKTYTDTITGSSFRYPPLIRITSSTQGKETIIKFSELAKEISLVVEPITEHNFFKGKKVANTFTYNNIVWNYLTGEIQYCDGGECGRISNALQTTYREKRYTIVLGDLPYPDSTLDQILSTFKFVGQDADQNIDDVFNKIRTADSTIRWRAVTSTDTIRYPAQNGTDLPVQKIGFTATGKEDFTKVNKIVNILKNDGWELDNNSSASGVSGSYESYVKNIKGFNYLLVFGFNNSNIWFAMSKI